jgi:uncharacterized protein YcbX
MNRPPENLLETAITSNGKQVRSGLRLDAIFVYPLKSARGFSPPAWALDRLGLAWDRRWLIALPDGRALTQREEPRLAQLVPHLGAALTVSAPGRAPLELLLEAPADPELLRVRIHKASLLGAIVSAAADAWVSQFLGYAARLVRVHEEQPIDPAYALSDADRTGFSDGYPLLLVGQGSVDDLNSRLPARLPAERFRPNLVVAGAPPFAEDGWRRIRVGELALEVVKPCARCVITTTDQQTGARGAEPLRTLALFRRTPAGKVLFGQNLIHLGTGTLRAGDVVTVLATVAPPELLPAAAPAAGGEAEGERP